MKNIILFLKINLIILQLLFAPLAFSKVTNNPKKTIDIKQLILPSEVSSLGKSSGSIYYSPSVKGKVLVPVHFWGSVAKAGLHYIPAGTTLVNGLSLAGGPRTDGDLEEVKITRKNGNKIEEQDFDLSAGGTISAYNTELLAGDTVFIPKDRFREDRVYYTSLFGVAATILSSILLYRQVKN